MLSGGSLGLFKYREKKAYEKIVGKDDHEEEYKWHIHRVTTKQTLRRS